MDHLATVKQRRSWIQRLMRGTLPVREQQLLLRIVDGLLVVLAICGSFLLWLAIAGRPPTWQILQSQAGWMILLFLGWVLWLELSDMYNLRLTAHLSRIVQRMLLGALIITTGYLFLFFITSRTAELSLFPDAINALARTPPLRLAPALAIGGATVLLLGWRTLYVWALSGPLTQRQVLIVGAGRAGKKIAQTIAKSHRAYYTVVGFIDDDAGKLGDRYEGASVLGGHTQIEEIIHSQQIDELIVAISAELPSELFQSLMACHEQGVVITPMPLLYEQLTGRIHVGHVGSQWYAALPLQQRSTDMTYALIKRVMDLLVCIVVGVVTLFLLPFLALAIKLDSPGPVFYRQERVGLYGRRFVLIKLRSMVVDAERDGRARWAVEDDDRVTRVGHWLRRMRLDELPQIWNVIRGDMSVVGPRPERPQFVEQLQSQIPYYRTRLVVRPGLTGWAQINWRYAATLEDHMVKLQYDLYYLKHQSPWFDLVILLRTAWVVFRMRGQ